MSARASKSILIAVVALACGRPATPPDPPLPSQTAAAPEFNPSSVRALEIEHTGCFGSCPIYRVRVTDAGELEYEGKKFVRHVGRLTATTYPSTVGPLFTWLRNHPTLYERSVVIRNGEDGEQVRYRFQLKNGETVLVESDVVFDGDEYWALSMIVDGVVTRALMKDDGNVAQHENKPAT